MKALLAIDGSTNRALGSKRRSASPGLPGRSSSVLTVLPPEADRYGGAWAAGVAYVPGDDLHDHPRTDRETLLEQALLDCNRPGWT